MNPDAPEEETIDIRKLGNVEAHRKLKAIGL